MRSSLLVILLGAIPAFAGVISKPTAGFFDSYSNPGVTGNIHTTINGAAVAGVACFGGFCPGEGTPGAGPDFNVSDPLTMKITSFGASCQNNLGCSVFVEANFSFYATAAAQYAVTLAIDGSGSQGLKFSYGGGLFNDNTGFGLGGNQTITIPITSNITGGIPPQGAINDSFSMGTIDVNAGDRIFAYVQMNLPLGMFRSINLPDSLTLTLADTAAVPEPATLGLMVAALAALAIGRKRL